MNFVVDFYLAAKDKIIPNADKNNQKGTFINLSPQCFEPWLLIPFTMINYLLLKSALVFVRTQKYFALCSI